MNNLILAVIIVKVLSPGFVQEGIELDAHEFEEKIEKVLEFSEIPYNNNFIHLLMGTAAVESDFGLNFGSGKYDLGLFQINRCTEKDILKRIIHKYPKAERIIKILRTRYSDRTHLLIEYQIILAAILYHERMDIEKLNSTTDVWRYAWYWKRYYNTYKGSGKTEHFFKKYMKYVNKD